jgi:isopenicillin N synthase-like dioxygenase
MSVLLQDETGGLQVKKGNKWVGVAPVPNALVINIGDQLQV